MGVCCGKPQPSALDKYKDRPTSPQKEGQQKNDLNSAAKNDMPSEGIQNPMNEPRPVFGSHIQDVPNEFPRNDQVIPRYDPSKGYGAPGPMNHMGMAPIPNKFHYRGIIPLSAPNDLDLIGDANISFHNSEANHSFSNAGSMIEQPQFPMSPNDSLAEIGAVIGGKSVPTKTTSQMLDTQLRLTELERKINREERLYRYRAKPLYALADIPSAFDRYNEMVAMPNLRVEETMQGSLLDANYLAEERTKQKNALIVSANSQLKYIELPVWVPSQHTDSTKIMGLSPDFTDPYFEFSEKVLKDEHLVSKRIRQYENPDIFHDDTMAEGIVFSERNLTPISAALSCLIHFDARLKTRLVKHLIYPQHVDSTNHRKAVRSAVPTACTWSKCTRTERLEPSPSTTASSRVMGS